MNCYQAAPSRWLSVSNPALPQPAAHSWFSLWLHLLPDTPSMAARLAARHLKRSTGNLAVPFRCAYFFGGLGVVYMKSLGTQKGSLLEFSLHQLRLLPEPSANSKQSQCLPNGLPLPVHKYLHLWQSRSPSASDW